MKALMILTITLWSLQGCQPSHAKLVDLFKANSSSVEELRKDACTSVPQGGSLSRDFLGTISWSANMSEEVAERLGSKLRLLKAHDLRWSKDCQFTVVKLWQGVILKGEGPSASEVGFRNGTWPVELEPLHTSDEEHSLDDGWVLYKWQ